MFEKYMIVETDVQHVVENGNVTGLQFGVRLPYYRGIYLSLLDDMSVTLDGHDIPRDDLRLTVHGNTYALTDLETEADDRWNMGEVAHISIPTQTALTPGEHQLALMVNLRIAYMPFPTIRKSEKTITVPAFPATNGLAEPA